jgi:hypothetical protein
MNFIQAFQSYHSLQANSMKSNALYKPSQTLIQQQQLQPVKKYTMPPDFFLKINNSVKNNIINTSSPQWRKIMYINTDLDYNFDDQVAEENALTKTNPNIKIHSYLITSICLIFPFTYYYYYYNNKS